MKEYVKYHEVISRGDKIRRHLWMILSLFLYRPFGLFFFNRWRIFVLRMFGAEIGRGSIVYSSVFIPAPWELEVGKMSIIGPGVKLHFGKTVIGNRVVISQRAYLCSATHDIHDLGFPLEKGIIVVNDYAWIAAEAFVMTNVSIGEGAVVGARAAVFKDVDPWSVVGGNPARVIKKRVISKREINDDLYQKN